MILLSPVPVSPAATGRQAVSIPPGTGIDQPPWKGAGPVKLLHLSDLHLGKSVMEVSMLPEQRNILDQIIQYAKRQAIDAILLAGDIYDRSVPPVDAVELLDEFLGAANQEGIPVLAVSGNHDSPERLQFGSRIFSRRGIHIAGTYSGRVEQVTLTDTYGPVHIYLLPFLRPVMVRQQLEVPVNDTQSAVEAALAADGSRLLPDRPDERNVLVAHQFVTAGGRQPDCCDSETLSVGGSDQVDAALFQGFDYVALGHLHQAQKIGEEWVRYAGSPLKYSLSEADHQKSFTVVTLREKGRIEWEQIPLTPLHDLRRIEGTLEELTRAGAQDPAREDYIWAVLTGGPVLDPAARLRQVYPNLLHVESAAGAAGPHMGPVSPAKPQESEEELFAAFFHDMYGKDMTEGQRQTVARVLRELREQPR